MSLLLKDRARLLRHKPFQYLMLHILLVVSGGGMSYIVVTWHVFAQTNSLQSVIINSMCFWLPSVLLSPVIGVLTDRYSRLQILISSNAIRFLAFFVAGFLLIFHEQLITYYTLTLINGIAFAIAMPAFSALMRELVTNDDLLVANTTLDITFELANVVGMGLAGVLAVALPAGQSLILVSVLIAVGTAMLLLIRKKDLLVMPKAVRIPFWQEWVIGIKTITDNRMLLLLSGLSILLFIEFMISPLLITPFVKDILHGGSQLFAKIELSLAVGMVVGSFAMPALAKRFGWQRCLWAGLIVITLGLLLFSWNRMHWAAILIYAVLGAAFPVWSLAVTEAQKLTPKAQQGRVQATIGMISSTAILLIYISMEQTTHIISLVHEYWLCGIIGIIAMVLLAAIHRLPATTNNPK